MKMRLVRIIIFLIIGITIGLAISYMQKDKSLETSMTELSENASILKAPVSKPETETETGENTDATTNPDIGGSFTLTDQDGKTVTQDTYKDSYKLIFFGFTYCPEVCPTALQKIQKVLDGLGDTANKIQPILITVDPERDTPELLKEFLKSFHPKQIGLTGTTEQIEAVKQSFRIYASKIGMEGGENYMFDHSAFLYLMSTDNKMLTFYPSSDTAEKIIQDIKNRNL